MTHAFLLHSDFHTYFCFLKIKQKIKLSEKGSSKILEHMHQHSSNLGTQIRKFPLLFNKHKQSKKQLLAFIVFKGLVPVMTGFSPFQLFIVPWIHSALSSSPS